MRRLKPAATGMFHKDVSAGVRMTKYLLCSVLAILLVAAPVAAQAKRPTEVKMDDETKKSVARGMEWLASKQNADGSWSEGRYPHNTAITAFALLAFMSQGNL